MTFDLFLKKIIFRHTFFILRDTAFIFGMCVSYVKAIWQNINFEHVTLTMIFDLLWKIFNIGCNFFILRDRAFMFGMCVPCDKAFPTVA